MTALGFAHRGGRSAARENTLAAFTEALRLGATGLESDVWLTADGVPVLLHDGAVRVGVRRRSLATMHSSDLPSWLPSLEDLYDTCGNAFDLSLDVKDPRAVRVVLAVGRAANALPRLWLCADLRSVTDWRGLDDDVRLVDSTRVDRIPEGVAARAGALRDAGVDALNLPGREWTADRVAVTHSAGVRAFGWDAHTAGALGTLLDLGCDGVYSDDVAAMVAALRARKTG